MKTYRQMAEDAAKAKEALQLTPTFVEFKEKGQQIVGAFISRAEIKSSTGKGTYFQYLFDTDDGRVKFHMGSVADSEFGESFTRGVVYLIEFLGKEKIPGGHSVNKWNVLEIGSTGDYSNVTPQGE